MNEFLEGLIEAFSLLFSFDKEIWNILATSLQVSGTAVVLATVIGLPIGSFLGIKNFRAKKFISNIINTFMGFPPVVMGLIIYILLSKSGPLGSLGLLYSTSAMIIAQFSLAIPIVIGTSKAAIENTNVELKETIISLGASNIELWNQLIRENKKPIIAGILVALGQAISEVGAVMIVGGNIRWSTRTFTTAIVLQTRMGEFGMAIALGMVLILFSFIINYALTYVQSK